MRKALERINQFQLYETGKEIVRIASLPNEATAQDCFFAFFRATWSLKTFVRTTGTTMRLSTRAANEILGAMGAIQKEYLEGENGALATDKFDQKVDAFRITHLQKLVQTFETIFAAEATEAATYTVPQRGIYATVDLIDRAIGHVPVELQSYLPKMAKQEFNAAGKCLAFELPTAAGFHALRAVECMIEDYYRAFAEAGAPKCVSWGDYIARLKSIAAQKMDKGPDEKTIRNLDQLRDLDRNPLMHPEETLSLTDALVLFNNAASAISAMAVELRAKKPEPELPLNPLSEALKIGAGTKLLTGG